MTALQYECECGWIGTEAEMGADSIAACGDEDEVWSNWICPKCGIWALDLEDYKEVTND